MRLFRYFVDYYELHCIHTRRRHVVVLNRKVSKGPFTLYAQFVAQARMKLAPVPILSVLGLPIYMVQARVKSVRVPISSVLCYKLNVSKQALNRRVTRESVAFCGWTMHTTYFTV